MGDWNTVVGERKQEKYIGHSGLGNMNIHGKRLVEFYKRRQFYITNTCFVKTGVGGGRSQTDIRSTSSWLNVGFGTMSLLQYKLILGLYRFR